MKGIFSFPIICHHVHRPFFVIELNNIYYSHNLACCYRVAWLLNVVTLFQQESRDLKENFTSFLDISDQRYYIKIMLFVKCDCRHAHIISRIWIEIVHNLGGFLDNIKGNTQHAELQWFEFHAIWSKGKFIEDFW